MHLVKWIRKNQRKIMTIVVIVIMVTFVGGTALQQILKRFGSGINSPIALYRDGGEITRMDVYNGREELKILRILGADRFLRFKLTASGTQDFKARMLAEILFPDSQFAVGVNIEMKQALLRGQLASSSSEIDKFFRQTRGRSELYWLLLKAEARQAGCVMPSEVAKNTLTQLVPQLTQNRANAAQVVHYIITEHRMAESKIIRAFADLIGVLAYSQMITSNEDVTIDQVKSLVGHNNEKIDAEFVKVPASAFVDEQTEPGAEELLQQFEHYKEFDAGKISDDNPYGFGYKLNAMARLDYLIVQMSDIRKIVTEPTDERMEEFYREYLDDPEYANIFKHEKQVDPNDPEFGTIEVTKSYVEAASEIKQTLIQEKVNIQADMIMNDARDMTEEGFVNVTAEDATKEELEKFSVDYEQVAVALSDEYKIKVHAGRTGMLTAVELADDLYLGTMTLEGQSQLSVPLSKAVFAVDEAGVYELGRFETAKPGMWQNIGPMKGLYDTVIGMVRIVEAQKASVPESIDATFSKKGVVLDKAQEANSSDDKEEIYSVKDKVRDDWKLIKAMPVAKDRATELAALLAEKDWDQAIEEINKRYSKNDEEDETAVPLFKLEELSGQKRSLLAPLKEMVEWAGKDVNVARSVHQAIVSRKRLDKLCSLIESGQSETGVIKSIVEFKPDASYYVVKAVKRTSATKDDYNKAKSFIAYQLDAYRSEGLGLTHFMPENITKRMQYAPVDAKDNEDTQDNEQAESDGAS